MDPIGTFSGLASGFQWRDMVDQMMQIEIGRRFKPVQAQVNAATQRREAWNTFNTLLGKFSTAARTLQNGTAFGVVKSSVAPHPAGRILFTATTSTATIPGSYRIEVHSLARADKIGGSAFASSADPLGIQGSFHLNGARVEVAEGDSLARIRDLINAANSGLTPTGVTATLLSTSATEHRLILTSDASGTRGIELVEGGAGTLHALGITTGDLARNQDPLDAGRTQSQRFGSHSIPLAAVLGVMPPPAVTTINVDGRKITVDLENDSLLSLMHRIQAAGGSAKLETERIGTREMQRLSVAGEITADLAGSDPETSQRLVELLGFQVAERAAPISIGADARFEIDGFLVQRRSNIISDVIEGVTLQLQVAEPGTALELNLTRDHGEVVQAAQALATAYNELVAFADAQRAPGAPLAANGSLRSTLSSLSRTFLAGVGPLPAGHAYTHASFVGIEFTRDGRLTVNATRLREALEENRTEIRTLLSGSGIATDPEIAFIGSGKQTQAGSHAIEITAPATRATHLGTSWTDPLAYQASDGTSDLLVLTDSFSGATLEFTLEEGSSLESVVAELNARFGAQKMRLHASMEAGALRISSTEYGASAGFTLQGSAVTRLGMVEARHEGSDVAGSIGGVPAIGSGRTLTGAPGSPAEGLALRYTGAEARAAGELDFVLGLAGMLDRVLEPQLRANDGIIATQVQAIDRSIASLNRRLDDIEDRLEVRRQALIAQFTRMESALSLMNSQGNWLASQIQSLQPRRS